MTDALDTREAVQSYLDRVVGPGMRWSMHRFPHGWALRSIPATPEEIERARQPGKSTWVLEESTGRITAHGPYPPPVIIQRYLTAIAEGRDPGGAQIYPEAPPPDPTSNAERLAPTPSDGSAKLYYFARVLSETTGPVIVTVLRSGADGHRSIRWDPNTGDWKCRGVQFLAQERYAAQFRPIDRPEADRLHRARNGTALPPEDELHQLCLGN